MLNYRWVLLNICRFICPMSIHVPSSDSTFEMAAAKVGQSWPWPAVQCLSSPKTRFCMGWYRLIIRWYCLVSLVYPNKIFGIIPRTVHFGYYELSHFRTRGRYRRSLLDEGWMLDECWPLVLCRPAWGEFQIKSSKQVLIRGWHSCANMECSVTLGWSPYEIHHLVWGCFEEIVIYTYPLPVQ